MTAWGIMVDLFLSSLNKFEIRVQFLFRNWHIPGYSLREALTALFHVFIRAVLCVRQKKINVQLADVEICISPSLLVLTFLSLSSPPLQSDFLFLFPWFSFLFLPLLFYPSKLLLASYLLEGGKGGKVPDDKSQWDCQRHIRKLVKSIATGYLFSFSTTCKKNPLPLSIPLDPSIKHGRPCKQRPSTVSTVLMNI